MKSCEGMEAKLAEMLLTPESVPAKIATHVAGCAACSEDLKELRATMALMDTWEAPEPNPFFMTRLNARLAEERKAAPAGWLERMKARYLYGPQLHARPLAAMALTVVLLLGGGTYLSLSTNDQPPVAPEAVVHDLQVLDNNAQVLDQLESMTNTDDNSGSAVN
ncbi:MAG TPA: hypothetical protein VK716_04310 [Terracidiphilus sp.]|nr:hypothetical protein [Terracidiphilus sp.]